MRDLNHQITDAGAVCLDDLYARLVRDALEALDRYRVPIEGRDPVKTLDEDRDELLRRLRAALEPLASKHRDRRDTVIQILSRIDEMLGESIQARS
jgi:uncharacterized protein YqgV (UPF0045/DUF77 family)